MQAIRWRSIESALLNRLSVYCHKVIRCRIVAFRKRFQVCFAKS